MFILYIPISIVLGTLVFIASVFYAKLPWIYAEGIFFVYTGLIIWWLEDKFEERRIRRLEIAYHQYQQMNAQARSPIVIDGESETVRSVSR